MAGFNRVIIQGNLGQDPEIRNFQNGGRVANLSVATSETWKDKNTGEKRERTEWHRVSVMVDGLVGVCERFLRKGSKVLIEGQLETRKWQDQSGQDRYTTEVVLRPYNSSLVMLDGRPNGDGSGQHNGGGGYGGPMQSGGQQGSAGGPGGFPDDRGSPAGRGYGAPGDIDDEIPF